MNIIDSQKLPIRFWLPIHQIESGAFDQAKNLANYPFAFNAIAVMPDTHQGYGMPIGAVLPTQEVIVPNAVGVDIGAVDKETEILTKKGWIKIDKYDKEDVLVWDNYEQTSFFSKPLLYIVKPCEHFTEYKNKYGLDQVLSDEHRMLVYKGYGENKEDHTYFCRDFREKLLKLKKQDYYSVRTTFPTKEIGVNLTDEQLRVRIMVSADGHIRKAAESYSKVELHFKKTRKIERSKLLLKQLGVDFNEYKNKDNTTSLVFELDWVCDKDLTDLFSCNQHQAEVIFNEYLYWDGTIDRNNNHKTYSSTSKNNADLIQYICALNNTRAGISCPTPNGDTWSQCHCVYRTQNAYVSFSKPRSIKIEGGNKYCFVVETGYFIARRNGKIFITGNCGMCATKTSIKTDELDKETIKKIFGGTKENQGGARTKIPVGFKHHSKTQDDKYLPENDDYTDIVADQINAAKKQIGTLGGGNHFIELQKGSDGYVWVMIHSGSRNVGFTVANHYNKLAIEMNEKWKSVVPKHWQLAFLPLDSEEGKNYIKDMNYCVDFALANRLLMMERMKESISEVLPETQYEEIINKPHNFATIENHMGKNVWVHRKGATRAFKGELGMIPGSQGTSSYIVKGRANKLSFMSCSHGAGRKMSRSKAREELSVEDEIAKLNELGVVHGIRHAKDLDEAPSAYKDIDEVMENQKDLVDIEVELKPLGVIKG